MLSLQRLVLSIMQMKKHLVIYRPKIGSRVNSINGLKVILLICLISILCISSGFSQELQRGSTYDTSSITPGALFTAPDRRSFIVEELIGSGNFGFVYKVRNTRTNELSAIKVNYKQANIQMHSFESNYIIPIEVFEARIHDVRARELESREVELMPLAEPLSKVLSKTQNPSDRLELALNLIRDISQGVFDLAREGFSHNDIKPDNILKLRDRFILTDLGSAKSTSLRQIANGSLNYMAPEQFSDFQNSAYSDIYQLAKTVLEIAFINNQLTDIFKILHLRFYRGYNMTQLRVVDMDKFRSWVESEYKLIPASDRLNFLRVVEFLEAGFNPNFINRKKAVDKYFVENKFEAPVRRPVNSCQMLFGAI